MDSKNVYLITLFTPTAENVGGPSALPYYLIRERNQNIKITIFSFNINNISSDEINITERQLNSQIQILKQPLWYKFIVKFKLHKVRFLLSYPLFAYFKLTSTTNRNIIYNNPDLVWFYPHSFVYNINSLSAIKKVVTGPDSGSLHYHRVLKDSLTIRNKWLSLAYYNLFRKEVLLEKNLDIPNSKIHLVGLEDYNFIKKISPKVDSFFLLHPHYEVNEKNIGFHSEKIKILIAGKMDIYTQSDAMSFFDVLKNRRDELKDIIELTYLGKGWDSISIHLSEIGYECKSISWVDNYTLELVKHDLQIFPISVGTGTKGKVLDSLANGLLCIGSKYAFENICVKNGESCLVYKNTEQIPNLLISIFLNKSKYEIIAECGRERVKCYHNPKRISKRFFEIALRS